MKKLVKKYIKIEYVLLLCIIVFYIFFLYKHTRMYLDDDMASEMVLSNLLYKEGKFVLTNTWMYSTEIRVLDMQIIFSILFRFFSNWFYVRFFGTLIIFLLFVILLFCLCKESDLSKCFPFILACFLLPLTGDEVYYMYIGLWYLIHIMYAIFILIVLFRYNKCKSKIKYLIIGFIVSIVFCLEGSRFILTIYLPLLFATIVSDIRDYVLNKKINIKNSLTLFSLISLFGGLVGTLINKFVLQKIYLVPGSMTPTIKIDFSRIFRVLLGLLENNGYNTSFLSKMISSIILISSIICIVYTLHNLKKVKTSILIYNFFYIFGVLGTMACFVLTDMRYYNRYLLLTSIFSIFVLFSTANEFNKNKKHLFISLIMSLYLISASEIYSYAIGRDRTTALDYICTNLVENDYFNGYGFFWRSNVLTELSKGKIDMWCWGESEYGQIPNSFREIDKVSLWLQNKNHINHAPKDKVFIILSDFENDYFKDLIYYFNDDNIIMNLEGFVVYGFDSYEQLKTIMHLS